MEVKFEDDDLRKLEQKNATSGRFSNDICRRYRKVMRAIRDAKDERDFRAMRSLNFEKLKGDRNGQFSFRINKQWRLVVTIQARSGKSSVVHIVEIIDYH